MAACPAPLLFLFTLAARQHFELEQEAVFFKLTSHHFLSPQQQMESTCVKTVRTADKKAATSLREICRPQTETVCISQMEKNTTPSD